MRGRLLQLMTIMLTGAAADMRGGVAFEGPVASDAYGTNRFVRISLPESYAREPGRRYPVLYVHDGQNAFTTAGTNTAFGWGNWALDTTAPRLAREGRMREIILVAVDCSRHRYEDYLGSTAPSAGGQGPDGAGVTAGATRYERYKRFLVGELKPRIDREYRTLPGAAHTGVLGSSMGGLCSLALAWERPDVFGGAACLSGAFQVERGFFLRQVLARHTAGPLPFRVYLDSGVVDFSGGDDGRALSDAVAGELRRIGWKSGRDLEHFVDAKPMEEAELERAGLRRDKWAEARTSQHNEFYWRERVWRALVFLFPPGKE